MDTLQLSEEEKHVLAAVLFRFRFVCPPTHPEWHDLTEMTKLTPQESLEVLNSIRLRLS